MDVKRWPRTPVLIAAFLLLSHFACSSTRPSDLPRDQAWMVVVKSSRLDRDNPWYRRFAHHTWIDVKSGSDGAWSRIESGGRLFGTYIQQLDPIDPYLNDRFGGNPVRVLGLVTGPAAERMAPRIIGRVAELNDFYDDAYVAWPGPNSNTLMMSLAREFPELAFTFDGNAVGKDFGGWLDASLTASKTGVRVDSVPLGFAVGVAEGIELHLLQLTFGVGFAPPCVKLPFLPTFPTDFGEPQPVPLEPTGEFDREWTLSGRAVAWTRHPLGVVPRAGRLLVIHPRQACWAEVNWSLVKLHAVNGVAPVAPHGVKVRMAVHSQTGTTEWSTAGYGVTSEAPAALSAPLFDSIPWSMEWTLNANGELEAAIFEGARFGGAIEAMPPGT
jgi:hypothetical protein